MNGLFLFLFVLFGALMFACGYLQGQATRDKKWDKDLKAMADGFNAELKEKGYKPIVKYTYNPNPNDFKETD